MLSEIQTGGFSQNYFDRLKRAIDVLDMDEVDAAIERIRLAWQAGRQIITLGNGGSGLSALHFIMDWNKGVYTVTGVPFRGRTLVDNIGLLTAYGNDFSYQDIFVEQLRNIAQPGDLVLAISGSGNSENVVRAVDHANASGCDTLALKL